jgi:ureidoglycolate lyase
MSLRTLPIVPLTAEAFAPFGDVIDVSYGSPIIINEGFAERINGLAKIDVRGDSAVVNTSLFTARVRPQPIVLRMMERHPHGSQLFQPLQDHPWLVVVCADPHKLDTFRAFRATGRQGVNYACNIWHHPLLVLADGDRFLVVDRGDSSITPLNNLEEVWLDAGHGLQLPIEGQD